MDHRTRSKLSKGFRPVSRCGSHDVRRCRTSKQEKTSRISVNMRKGSDHDGCSECGMRTQQVGKNTPCRMSAMAQLLFVSALRCMCTHLHIQRVTWCPAILIRDASYSAISGDKTFRWTDSVTHKRVVSRFINCSCSVFHAGTKLHMWRSSAVVTYVSLYPIYDFTRLIITRYSSTATDAITIKRFFKSHLPSVTHTSFPNSSQTRSGFYVYFVLNPSYII